MRYPLFILKTPGTKARFLPIVLKLLGGPPWPRTVAEPFAGSPAELGKFIVDYTEKWGKVIRAAGIKAE